MIHFFRRIRQGLLSQNRFSKYMLYAIGEILLVVIGILIALQINNWNEYRKDRIIEKEFLVGLKETLQRDLVRNVESQKINRRALNSMQFLAKHIEQDLPYNDSLKYQFGNMSQFYFWDLSESVFESLKAKGLDIITNNNLRDSLALAYGNHNKSINYAGFRYHDYMDHAILNIFSKHFKKAWDGAMIDEDNSFMIPIDYENLKRDTEFVYFLNSLPNLHHYKLVLPLQRTQRLLERLLYLIDQELYELNE